MTSSSAARPTEAPAATLTPAFFDCEAWAARTARPGDRFDERAADHAERFYPRFLRHSKGRWAGKPFTLRPEQRTMIRAAFGWKRADGTRRFRVIYKEVPRKNGKTTEAAGLALYLAFASGEGGAEVYCCAADAGQAMIVFGEAKRMRAQSPALKARTLAYKLNMSCAETNSKVEVLSKDIENKDGLNVSGLVYDEFHKAKTRDMYDVLHTATGARDQPMELIITTAGASKHGPCWEMHDYAVKVRDGVIDDHEFLPVLYGADETDDIYDPATWAKANPGLGDTIGLDYLAKEAEKARVLPRYRNTFKRNHLNIWTDQDVLWLPRDKWSACDKGATTVTLEALANRRCHGGLDLSSTTDLSALVLDFPKPDGGHDWWAHFWLPKEDLAERVKRDRVPYDRWAEQGFITLTEGNVVDYDAIRRTITGVLPQGAGAAELATARAAAIVAQVDLADLAIDRWNATQLATQLMADGVNVVQFGQGFASMSAPSKECEKLVLNAMLNHGGNPVLAWMAGVVSIRSDPAGNIKPVKPDRQKSSARIDGIVAGIMALGRAIAAGPAGKSFWEAAA